MTKRLGSTDSYKERSTRSPLTVAARSGARNFFVAGLCLIVLSSFGALSSTAQVPAKCSDVALGTWTAQDTLGVLFTSGADSLVLARDDALCIVAGAEWVRHSAPPSTPGGAWIEVTPLRRAFMVAEATDPDALALRILAHWYVLWR